MSCVSALDLDNPGLAEATFGFDYWLTVSEQAEWVEEPNARRKGSSGVKRACLNGQEFFIKTQIDHCHYSFRYPLGRPTALREANALETCHRLGILAPQIVFCQTRKAAGHHHTLLVTRGLAEFISLEDFLLRGEGAVNKDMRWRALDDVAATFSRLHRSHWQHSAMYPKHVFVARQAASTEKGIRFDVALLDLEKARRRMSAAQASQHDIGQFQRHTTGLDIDDWRHFLGRYSHYLGRSRQ